jgi:plastocyanin
MRRVTASVSILALAAMGALIAGPSMAGPEKIAFPAAYKTHVLYTTVDRHDVKQYRELYGSPDAVQALKDGRPLPHGSVLTLVQYKAQVDAAGTPVKDSQGRFVKGDLIAYAVMEKRAGWGAEYPAELRNGEWEYAVFTAAGTLNETANYKACFQCHKPHEAQDFVISMAHVRTGTPVAYAPPADVKIAGFAFGPARLSVPAGTAVTWLNTDDSPHQVTVTSGAFPRSPILNRGQAHAQAFAAAGVYDYICGLHPNMKGQIEVK